MGEMNDPSEKPRKNVKPYLFREKKVINDSMI